MATPREIVDSYYAQVDKNNFNYFYQLFSKDIIYERGEKILTGLNTLIDFYTNERKIKGEHTIDSVIDLKDLIVVTGIFKGINNKSEKIIIDFADFFYFNQDLTLVIRRKTYLATGYNSTK